MPGVVNTTYTFANNDLVTSTRLNNIIGETAFTSDAIVSGNNTLLVTGGKLMVKAGGITSNELAANSVVTTKITDLNVTTGKLADLAVTTGKLADSAVTTAKITDANVTTAKIADDAITLAKLNTTQAGSAPIYAVRAWCDFDCTKNSSGGTDSLNTARFLRSGANTNVASVTKTASGKYTVLFSVAMPDANYVVVPAMTQTDDSSDDNQRVPKVYSKTTSGFSLAFYVGASGSAAANPVSGTFVVLA